MARHELQLDLDDILDAAVAILREDGLEGVSMRSVSARLGVSPVPLYSRVGNKDALIDAIAERLLDDLAPSAATGEPWPDYAMRWAHELRRRLQKIPDARLILSARRWAYVEASKALIEAMRAGGVEPDVAVRHCRLLMWATIGFAVLEAGALSQPPTPGRRRRLPGGDPTGVTAEDAGELFALHVQYLVDGLVRDTTPSKVSAGARRSTSRVRSAK